MSRCNKTLGHVLELSQLKCPAELGHSLGGCTQNSSLGKIESIFELGFDIIQGELSADGQLSKSLLLFSKVQEKN